MDRPIFLIGAARSGTTVIAELLAAHPDVAFWNEPRYVWRHGGHGTRHDVRPVDEATPAIASHIRKEFERFLAASGHSRFLEKTPSNCFRVGFMHRVFPEGLFLHLQRDGRHTAASALHRWCSKPDDAAIFRRLRGFEIPVTALHHYLPDIVYELVLRRVQPDRGYLWGPRYPEIHEDLRMRRSIAEICARQWALSEESATTGLSSIPRAQQYSFRYERLLKEPDTVLSEILAFAGLKPVPEVYAAARKMLMTTRVDRRKQITESQRRQIDAICLPAMERLGMITADDLPAAKVP